MMVVSNSKNLKNTIEPLGDRQELAEELIEFQTLVENTKVMMLIFQDDRICYANPMTEILTGYSKEELLVNTDLVQQLKLKPKKRGSKSSDGRTPYRQVKLSTKNGNQCWLDCSIRLIQFRSHPAIFITAVDITQYKEAEQNIQQTLEREQKLVAMVAHELRAPLNVISFSSRLLNHSGDRSNPAKAKEYLERLQRGVDTLSLLIDEWLILEKVDRGQLKFEPRALDLEQFCRNLLSDLHIGNRHRQQINFLSQGNSWSVKLDRRIIQLILTNLLENALKYSPEASKIHFTLTCTLQQVTFKIKDQGIGIKQSDRDRLFEPFYRGENVDNISGHGLGLTVVKKLVALHNGQITIHSELGVGTEFVVAFPQKN